jgi:hypothetical protein
MQQSKQASYNFKAKTFWLKIDFFLVGERKTIRLSHTLQNGSTFIQIGKMQNNQYVEKLLKHLKHGLIVMSKHLHNKNT